MGLGLLSRLRGGTLHRHNSGHVSPEIQILYSKLVSPKPVDGTALGTGIASRPALIVTTLPQSQNEEVMDERLQSILICALLFVLIGWKLTMRSRGCVPFRTHLCTVVLVQNLGKAGKNTARVE